jgi:enoyl-CoA hydratase
MSDAEASAPGFAHIRLEHESPISWIVLNRPDKANALSNEMLDEFSYALDWLRTHGEPVIVIRGEGKGFSAGYDFGQVAGETKTHDPLADRARLKKNLGRYLALWEHPKPVIAAVHGYCIGGASQMITLADITLVADDVKIGIVAVPIGAGYTTPVLSTVIGPKRAKELSFVPGNSIDGRTAVEWGLANHVVPAAELLDRTRSLAERIALTPPDLLTIKKAAINSVTESMGSRQALAQLPQFDALAHTTSAVAEVRAHIASEGLKDVIKSYRVPPTSDLSSEK